MPSSFKWGTRFEGKVQDKPNVAKSSIEIGGDLEVGEYLTLTPYWINMYGASRWWIANNIYLNSVTQRRTDITITAVQRGNRKGLRIELAGSYGIEYTVIPGIIHTNIKQVGNLIKTGDISKLQATPYYYGANNNVGHIRCYRSPLVNGNNISLYASNVPNQQYYPFCSSGPYINSMFANICSPPNMTGSYANPWDSSARTAWCNGSLNPLLSGGVFSEILSLRFAPHNNIWQAMNISNTAGYTITNSQDLKDNWPVWCQPIYGMGTPSSYSSDAYPADANPIGTSNKGVFYHVTWTKGVNNYVSPLLGYFSSSTDHDTMLTALKAASMWPSWDYHRLTPWNQKDLGDAVFQYFPENYIGIQYGPTTTGGIRIQSNLYNGDWRQEPFDILVTPSIWSPWGGIDIIAGGVENTSGLGTFEYETLHSYTGQETRPGNITGIILWNAYSR